jgi:predicted peptidase
MNRRHALQALGAAALPDAAMALAPGEHAQRFDKVVRKHVALRYLIWMPDAASKPAAGWPLVFFLHGSGERGRDLARVKVYGPARYAAAGRQFPFVLVAPQVPEGLGWDGDALEALRVDLLARLPIDPDRVLMTGLSMGGYGTSNYALDHPHALAAIAPVCGAGDSDRAARIKHLPVWAFHGALDDAVPIAADREMVDALTAAGSHVKFTIYPDLSHNAWDRAYADEALYAWLMAQHRSSPR